MAQQYFTAIPSVDATIFGRLFASPEMRYTPAGKAVTSLRMAVSRSYQGKDGNWVEVMAPYRVSIFGDGAEFLNRQNLAAGDVVQVTYRPSDLKASGYLDKEQKPAASIEVIASRVKWIARKTQAGDAAVDAPAAEGSDEEIPF